MLLYSVEAVEVGARHMVTSLECALGTIWVLKTRVLGTGLKLNAITFGGSEGYYLYHAGLCRSDDVGFSISLDSAAKRETEYAATPHCSYYTRVRNSKCKRRLSCVMVGR